MLMSLIHINIVCTRPCEDLLLCYVLIFSLCVVNMLRNMSESAV
jgi:hypothetical protein